MRHGDARQQHHNPGQPNIPQRRDTVEIAPRRPVIRGDDNLRGGRSVDRHRYAKALLRPKRQQQKQTEREGPDVVAEGGTLTAQQLGGQAR